MIWTPAKQKLLFLLVHESCLVDTDNPQPRKKNQMNKILIAYIIGLIVGAGSTLFIVEQLLK